jgi:hypothetical protein
MVEGALYLEWLGDVLRDECEPRIIREVRNIAWASGEEIVQPNNYMSFR